MIFNDTEIGPGEKKQCSITIDAQYKLPVWIICGKKEGKTLVITAGVHGCEYVGMITAQKLFLELDTEKLQGTIIILPCINLNGFYAGLKQIFPEDNRNLNREFPSKNDGSMTSKIVQAIESEIFTRADFLMDLHGGDSNEAMTPLAFFSVVAAEEVNIKSKEGAMHLPVKYRIPTTSTNGLFSGAAEKGVPSFLLEIGGDGRWSQEEVTLCMDCVRCMMGYLDMGEVSAINSEQYESLCADYEKAADNGFWYPYISPESPVKTGDILGELKDITGKLIKTYCAKFDGIILYYTTSLGVKDGDPLIAYCKIK